MTDREWPPKSGKRSNIPPRTERGPAPPPPTGGRGRIPDPPKGGCAIIILAVICAAGTGVGHAKGWI